MFKIHDAYGIVAAALVLVFVYLVLNNSLAATSVVSAGADASNNILKTLQGR